MYSSGLKLTNVPSYLQRDIWRHEVKLRCIYLRRKHRQVNSRNPSWALQTDINRSTFAAFGVQMEQVKRYSFSKPQLWQYNFDFVSLRSEREHLEFLEAGTDTY